MNYKTIMYKDVTDEQISTIHNLLKSISGMNPKDYDKYGIRMSYDAWCKYYTVKFNDTKIQIQLLGNSICHLRYGTTRGEIFLEEVKDSLRFMKYYNPLIQLVQTYGECTNNLVHIKTLKENDIVNGIKIVEIANDFVYYIQPSGNMLKTYDTSNILKWSYTSNNDRFDALEWGIILVEPTTIMTVIETNDTLLGLI